MSGDDSRFKVTDRRSFTADGKPREPEVEAAPEKEAEASAEKGPVAAPDEKAGAAADAVSTPRPPESAGPPPEIDFTTFLLSLAANAIHHLEEGSEGSKGAPNLPLAKQTIDIVGLLREKTRGNLSGEEERLLEGILYDLQMRFVAATRSG